MTRVMTMTLHAAGLASADDADKARARATFTLRRGAGLAIAAGGIAVLILEAIVRLHGG
ncbi:hypothetical protein [Paraburkholderia ferrariae]|uniref:hypothetical protein n=1 Tax=Paraburkholderia ferrariae TaxID=386056 RepID=UPI000A5929A7|nr:hypothetical protein [Paraburkholderia ferrariae]